jgi:hypothetical protein
VLQLLTVPANGDEKTSMALASGTAYTIRVSGVFMFGHCDPSVCPGGGPDYIRWSDAGRRTDNHFSSVYAAMYVGLEINGILIAFSSYHQDHTYTVARTGNGQALKFRLRDCVGCYGDNAGQLRVEILTGSPAATLLPVKHFQ